MPRRMNGITTSETMRIADCTGPGSLSHNAVHHAFSVSQLS